MSHGHSDHGDKGGEGHKPQDSHHEHVEHELQKDFDSGDAHRFLKEMKKDGLEVAQVTVDKEFGTPEIVLHKHGHGKGHDGKDDDDEVYVLKGHGHGWDKVKVKDDGTIEFKNGCKIDKDGNITFADGMKIEKNGVICDKDGKVLDNPLAPSTTSTTAAETAAESTAVAQTNSVETVARQATNGSTSITAENLTAMRAGVEELARRIPGGIEMLHSAINSIDLALSTRKEQEDHRRKEQEAFNNPFGNGQPVATT